MATKTEVLQTITELQLVRDKLEQQLRGLQQSCHHTRLASRPSAPRAGILAANPEVRCCEDCGAVERGPTFRTLTAAPTRTITEVGQVEICGLCLDCGVISFVE